MKIVISGSTGLIGSALSASLRGRGDVVIPLVRGGGDGIPWDIDKGQLDAASLEGVDAVVHLAGESVAEGRWTAAKKARIRDSRVKSTALLCGAIARLSRPPRVMLSASAIGYYGDRGDETLDEESLPGLAFLADVCKEWEQAATGALRETSTRLATMRIGVVLSPKGGALAKMLPPFRMGAGGIVGPGTQYMSWIDLIDIVRAMTFLIDTNTEQGVYNMVAPNPVTNREFTKTLGKVLRRPTLFPVPVAVLRTMFGEMADGMLLASARVYPKRLSDAGFTFEFPELEQSLRHCLSK